VIPSSALGLGVLLCLVPGLLYVRLTERTRHPRESSTLLEGVEVLATGLLAVTAVAGPITLLNPAGTADLLNDPFADPRQFVASIAVLVAGSTAAAFVLARLRLWRHPARYCRVPGLMEALIPRKDESHGSTEEVPRGASGAGYPDGGRSAA
jgi:hypothetical protein